MITANTIAHRNGAHIDAVTDQDLNVADHVAGRESAAASRTSFWDQQHGGEHHRQPIAGEDPEHAAPGDDKEQLRADHRRDDRCEARDERDLRGHLHESLAAEQVPYHGGGDDCSARRTESLGKAGECHELDRRRQRDERTRADVHRGGDDERPPPTEGIAQRADDELSGAHAHRRRCQRGLHRGRGSEEITGHGRERRQVQIHREGPERRERPEHDGEQDGTGEQRSRRREGSHDFSSVESSPRGSRGSTATGAVAPNA
jgi:hypothetical protein